MDFQDKIVFVSGTNRGIGTAWVEGLLKRNVKKIYASARTADLVPDFRDKRVIPIPLDITNVEQVQAATQSAPDTNILINNAGAATYSSILDGNLDDVHHDMNINYYGTLNMMRAFIPVLEQQTAPAVVNIVSIVAFANFPFVGGYCASKAALFSASQGARIELAAKGIAVHTINPGPIDTDMAKAVDLDKPSPQDAVASALDALGHDELDIFPDAIGRAMFEMWRKNYHDLEHAVADMFNGRDVQWVQN